MQRNDHLLFAVKPIIVWVSVTERVVTYKLLGVYISEDLSWNVRIKHMVKKADKCLHALRTLKEVASAPCSYCKCIVALYDLY